MQETMRALQIMGPDDARVVIVPLPEPAAGEVLVRVRAIAVCSHWDLTLLAGKDIFERPGYPRYPISVGVPGHEMSGQVAALGPDAELFRVGDRVAAWTSRASALPGRYGYYAEYAAVPEDCLMPVPEHLSFEEAAPLEMAMCVASSIRQAGDMAGKTVAVGGAGPAGLMAIQMACALGARRIIAFDPVEGRRSLALFAGADITLDPAADEVKDLPSSTAEIAIECAGAAASAENLMRVTSGSVHLFGVVHGTVGFTMDHWMRNVRLFGYPGHFRESAELALALMTTGALRTDFLIGTKVGFDRYREGLATLKSGKVAKVCIVP